MKETIDKDRSPDSGSGGLLIKRKDSVLVVIDVQERLVPAISNHEKLIDNIVKLVRFAKIVDMPVIMVEQEKLGPTVKAIKDELPYITPVKKVEFSAVGCSEFVKKLSRLSKSNVILAGVEAHVCVTQTALELLPDYNVYVVGDAISSRSLENRDIALRRLTQNKVAIGSTEMVIYELMEKAGTDEFKKVLGLIK